MIREIGSVIVIPVTLACAVMVLTRWVSRRGTKVHIEPSAFGIALTMGFMASFFALEGWWQWPPAARWQWLPFLAGAAAVVGVFASRWPNSFGMLALCAAVVGSLATWMIQLPGVDSAAWRVGLGGVVCTLAILLGRVAQTQHGATLPFGLAAVFATMGPLFIISHFAKMAMLTGCVAAIHGVAALLALRDGRFAIGPAGSAVTAALIPTFVLTGYSYDYGSVKPASWAVVAAAPAAIWLSILLAPAGRSPRVRCAVRSGCVLIPCVIAIALTDFAGAW